MQLADLPEELVVNIAQYLSRTELKKFFDVPVFGDICFNQYYRNISIRNSSTSYSLLEFEKDGEPLRDLTDEFYRRHRLQIHRPFLLSPDLCDISFQVLDNFISFYRKNQHRLKHPNVTFDTCAMYLALEEKAADILADLSTSTVKMVFPIEDLEPSSKWSSQIHAKLFNLSRKKNTPIEYLALRSENFRLANRPALAEDFLPLGLLSELSRLSLKYLTISNFGRFIAPLQNLRILVLESVPIEDTELKFLPSTIEDLTLIRLLQFTSHTVELDLPPNLRGFELNSLTFETASDHEEYYIDMMSPAQLKYVSITNVKRLETVQLPQKMEHLIIKSSPQLIDLTSIEKYEYLRSLTVSPGRLLSIVSLFHSVRLPDTLQYLRFEEFNQIVAQDWVTLDEKEERDGMSVTYKEERLLLVDWRFHFPKDLQVCIFNSSILAIDFSIRLPDSLVTLSISRGSRLLKLRKIKFPQSLRELTIDSCTVTGLEGTTFPVDLRKLILVLDQPVLLKGTNLGQLHNLQELCLECSYFRGGTISEDIPKGIELLTLSRNKSLKHLDLLSCLKLKKASLSGCLFSELSPEYLKLPDSLECLELDHNPIYDCSSGFRFPSGLRELNILKVKLLMEQRKFFLKLPNCLRKLSLTWGYNARREKSIVLPETLEELLVTDGGDGDILMRAISKCKALRVVALRSMSFECFNFSQFPTSLHKVILSAIRSGGFVGDIGALENLIGLELVSMKLPEIKFTLPRNLMNLTISDTDVISLNDHIEVDGSGLLQLLLVTDNDSMEHEDLLELLENILGRNPNFKYLEIDDASDELVTFCKRNGIEID